LASGRASSFGEIAARVGVTDRYVTRIVDLAFLAPDVVEAMLNGEQAAGLRFRTSGGLLVSTPLLVHMVVQRALVGQDLERNQRSLSKQKAGASIQS
jgi:hypothetical protein